MDGNRFDDLLRTIVASRRPFVRGLVAAGAAGPFSRLAHDEEAMAKKKSKGKRKNKKKSDFDPRCRLGSSSNCPGCCDQQLRCRDGLAADACGIGIEFCAQCLGDEECTSVNGEMQCCVPLDGTCDPVNFTCCPDLQCGSTGRCCAPNGGECGLTSDCCDGECVNGTCCTEGDRACTNDDECCGGRPCLRLFNRTTQVCCPENRQCDGRCCVDSEDRYVNVAGNCSCCEPPKELCQGTLDTQCFNPETQQCCEETGMTCGLNSTCRPGQLACDL